MVNKPKDKGTKAETRVVNYLTQSGLRAHRAALKGNHDEGDVHIIGAHGCTSAVLEVKCGKQTTSMSRKDRADWLAQTRVEATNHGSVRGFLVIAKHRSSVPDYQVWSEDGSRFWYLDDFVEFVKGGF